MRYQRESNTLEQFKESLLKRLGNRCEHNKALYRDKNKLKDVIHRAESINDLLHRLRNVECWALEVKVL